jgi:hypothetical protein
MSAPPKQYVDGILVEYGARLFYPRNRVQNRSGRTLPLAVLAGLARRGPAARPPITAAAVRTQIRATLRRAPQAVVKVTGGGRGMSHVAAHFSYISRNGQLEMENERGEKIQGKEALKELREDWKYGGSEIPERSPRREAFNIVLSMPRDVDSEDVRAAAREFAGREFANHAYVFVLHRPDEDHKSDRPHVHLAVRAEGIDGRRLNPRKDDLQRWREGFAQALAERGVEALATRRESRGETRRPYPLWQAHTPRRRPDRDVTSYEIDRQRKNLGAWREIATALAQSPETQDRQTAVEITKFVAEMPAVQLLVANDARAREPERAQEGPHALLERKRAGLER